MPIRGTTRLLGILGNPLDHSFSPAMHNAALEALGLDYAYLPFAVKGEDLGALLSALKSVNFAGVNVTMPHKQAVMEFLDEVSELSRLLGAVNTITHKDGKLHGHTTDPEGFLRGFAEAGHSFEGKSVVILGNGGSARTIAFTLLYGAAGAKPARVALAARDTAKSEGIAKELYVALGLPVDVIPLERYAQHAAEFDIVVNATPLGMGANHAATPIPAETVGGNQIVYDIISNPEETTLMRNARARGAAAVGGLGMLVHQGVASFKIWTGVDADPALYYAGIRRQQQQGAAAKTAAA
jgi:shikimate dehydrogenase